MSTELVTAASDAAANEPKGSMMEGGRSFLDQTPLLDIAFLQGIATHRPLGPHKHFNVIPILLHLERTVERLGPRLHVHIRSGGKSDGYEDSDEEDSDDDSDNEAKEHTEAASDTKVKIKQEADLADVAPVHINADMIWQRLQELYDVEGLDELEDQAADGDDSSPFYNTPSPTYATRAARKLFGKDRASPPLAFGYGNGILRLPDEDVKPAPSSSKSTVKRDEKSRAQSDEEDDEDSVTEFVDFELGPWEDYEDLIAPRRRQDDKGDVASDDETDLSSPAPKEAAGTRSKPNSKSQKQDAAAPSASKKRRRSSKDSSVADEGIGRHANDDAIKEEHDDGEESADEEDDHEDDAESADKGDEEQDDQDDDEEEKRPAKRGRQTTASSTATTPASRRGQTAPSSARGKRAGGTPASARASPSPAATTRGSRGSTSAASAAPTKPRRSGRR